MARLFQSPGQSISGEIFQTWRRVRCRRQTPNTAASGPLQRVLGQRVGEQIVNMLLLLLVVLANNRESVAVAHALVLHVSLMPPLAQLAHRFQLQDTFTRAVPAAKYLCLIFYKRIYKNVL